MTLAIGFGELLKTVKLPEIVGAIIAGIILGPALLKILSPNNELSAISTIALFFIILQIGIEESTDIFSFSLHYMVRFASLSFIVPLIIMTIGGNVLFHIHFLQSFATSLAIAIPSISIVSVLLVTSGLIETDDGRRLLGGVAFSDLIAFVILSSIKNSIQGIVVIAASLTAFIILLYILDRYLKIRSQGLIERAENFIEKRESLLFAIVILMGFAVSSLFEYIGLTFVLGAFFSGLIIHGRTVGERAHGILMRTFSRINNSFFIPLFFGLSGILVTRISLNLIPATIFFILITSIVGGTFTYLIAKKYLKGRAITAVGIFGARGAVGVIIASISLSRGLINNDLYTSAILATVVMAIVFSFIFNLSIDEK
ncbi:MAG: cation:proton antiporter [Thermoplasmatales archaeon]